MPLWPTEVEIDPSLILIICAQINKGLWEEGGSNTNKLGVGGVIYC